MNERLEQIRDGLGSEREIPLWRRLAWPTALAAAWAAWYAAESLSHRRKERDGYEAPQTVLPCSTGFRRASEALTGHIAIPGNRAELLINGDRIFPSMLEAIRGAEQTINLETYVYWQGDISDQIASAICERARAGVECRILLDAIGSAKMRPGILNELRDAGARPVRFRPPAPRLLGRLANRSHRRVLVVDGRIGFTGGVGIAEEWTGDAQDPDHWRDTHLRIEGPAVRALQGTFGEHWVEATGEPLAGEQMLPELEPLEDGSLLQVVRSGSKVGDSTIEILYYLAIASAEQTIDLTAAYFAPRPAFIEALCEASERGVRVRILVPGENTDKEFVRRAARNTYGSMLECGVEFHEYEPTMLHAKTMVVDGCWASVGTVNFDNRSFQLNDELTICSFDGRLATELGEVFEHDLTRSRRIEHERFSKRGALQQAWETATVPVRREL